MRYDACGLWPILPGFNVHVYDHTHRQFLKGYAMHGVSMKVHFSAAVSLNEPVTAIDKEAHNASPGARAGLWL